MSVTRIGPSLLAWAGNQINAAVKEKILSLLSLFPYPGRTTTAIESLPERQRRVISLYYLEGMKLREIGGITGVTESRVSQVHSSALEKLRIKLLDSE